MRLLVNAVGARTGGGVRHLSPFLHSLGAIRPTWRFQVVLNKDAATGLDGGNIQTLYRAIPEGLNARRLIWDQIQVPRLANSMDVLLSPMNFGALGVRRPQIIWQRNPTYFDPLFIGKNTAFHRSVMAAYRSFAIACCRRADRVVVPSKAMFDLLGIHTDLGEKVVVIPHGFDPPNVVTGHLEGRTARRWARAERRLLYVSNPARHKNVALLPAMLSKISGEIPEARLGVTFARGTQSAAAKEFDAAADRLGVTDRLDYLGPIPQDEVHELYALAHVTLFPSFTESFGFPLLEALWAGCRVVASDIASNREITGGLADFHDPENAEQAAELTIEALRSTPTNESLRQMREHVRLYNWERSASEAARLIEELVGDVAR